VRATEQWLRDSVRDDHRVELLRTVPGLGDLLATVVALEIDRIERFASAAKLAAYAGLVPTTYSSSGQTFHGKLMPQTNKWLRWRWWKRPGWQSDWTPTSARTSLRILGRGNILAKQRYGRADRGLVRWFVRNNPRHPSRHVLTVGAILLAELLPQRGLFIDHHGCKREEPKEHAPRRHPFVAEQQRLAQ
jgi:hypothetical protein